MIELSTLERSDAPSVRAETIRCNAAWQSDIARELAELRGRLRAAEAVLDCVRSAVFVLDSQANIRLLNRSAQRLLNEGDGLGRIGNVLVAQVNGDATALRHLIARAAGADGAPPASGTLKLRRGPGCPPLAVVAIPALQRSGPVSRAARDVLLFVADPADRTSVAAELLQEVFGLTKREADVVLAILRHGALRAAATELKVELTTARSHLKHVFDKTGTRNQLALMQMLSALGALPDRHSPLRMRCDRAAA